MISCFSAALIGAFRSLLFHSWVICSLSGPQSHDSPVVVFLDRGHPRFWNFYSTHPVDVVRVKSYMNCLFDSARVVIRVTIEEGKFDTTILREPDCQLTTSVYRKPTHTDQYLAYDSHHPRSVKRGIVKCLYERAKGLVTKPSPRRKNICHLFRCRMIILFISSRNLPRPDNQTTVPKSPTSSKLLRFYLMSKVCPNSFAVAYKNKAYTLFSSRRLR